MQSFSRSGKLLKEINHTFVTLVPRTSNASTLSSYCRPISCINVLYKLISKVLSKWLKAVIHDLISENQSAFLQGRKISDATMLAHELVRDFNNPMGSRLCLTIDLLKAFDNVNREFIYYMMHCTGFSHTWIGWIRAYIEFPSFSIMVNGSPSGVFTSNRGIRQGDPLSPYLFVLVIEFSSIRMSLASLPGRIQPVKRGQHAITHLLFVDAC